MLWWKLWRLRRKLFGKSVDAACQAAKTLGTLKDRRGIALLVSALRHENPKVRGYAATALGELGASSAVQALTAACRDSEWQVRDDAVCALSRVSADRAVLVPVLLKALQDRQPRVRYVAASALAAVADERETDALIRALDDRHTRESAEAALRRIGTPGCMRALEEFETKRFEMTTADLGAALYQWDTSKPLFFARNCPNCSKRTKHRAKAFMSLTSRAYAECTECEHEYQFIV